MSIKMLPFFLFFCLSTVLFAQNAPVRPSNVTTTTAVQEPLDTLYNELLFQEDLFLDEFTFRPNRGLGLRVLSEQELLVFFEHFNGERYELILLQMDTTFRVKQAKRIPLAEGHRVGTIFHRGRNGLLLVGEYYGEQGQQVWTTRFSSTLEKLDDKYLFQPNENRFLEQAEISAEGTLFLLVGSDLEALELWKQKTASQPLQQIELQKGQKARKLYGRQPSGVYLAAEKIVDGLEVCELMALEATGAVKWKHQLSMDVFHKDRSDRETFYPAPPFNVLSDAVGYTYVQTTFIDGRPYILSLDKENGTKLNQQFGKIDGSYQLKRDKNPQLLFKNQNQLFSLFGYYGSEMKGCIHHPSLVAYTYTPSNTNLKNHEGMVRDYPHRHLFNDYDYPRFDDAELHDAVFFNNQLLLLYDNLGTKDLRLRRYGKMEKETDS